MNDARKGIQVGMVVHSDDGHRLGKVIAADDQGLQVERGLFFKKEYEVRYEDVRDVEGDAVYLRSGRDALQPLAQDEAGRDERSGEDGHRGGLLDKVTGGDVAEQSDRDTAQQLGDRNASSLGGSELRSSADVARASDRDTREQLEGGDIGGGLGSSDVGRSSLGQSSGESFGEGESSRPVGLSGDSRDAGPDLLDEPGVDTDRDEDEDEDLLRRDDDRGTIHP